MGESIFQDYLQFILATKPQNDHLELPYVVKNTISRTAGERRTRARERPSCVHMGARRFQRAIARPNPTTIIQNRPAHYIYYYIDFVFISGNCITESGIPCSFPFYYQGIRYDSCTTVNDINDKHWCSIQTDTNGQHRAGTDTWGYCQLQSSIHCLPNK